MWLDSKAVNCPQKWGNFSSCIIRVSGWYRSRGQVKLTFENNPLLLLILMGATRATSRSSSPRCESGPTQ